MKVKIVLVAMICFALAACATYTAVDPNKPVTLSNGVTVDPQVPWATSASGFAGTVWTIDGLRLNSLRFLTGITPGNPVMTIPGINKKDMITYNTTMLPNDVIDMVASTLNKAGYQQVRADGLRPVPFGSAAGFRFDLSLTTMDGLLMKGAGLSAQRDGKLDVIFFLAPAEYYYEHHLPTVERIFSSIRVPPPTAKKS
jgi:hypothetical protein